MSSFVALLRLLMVLPILYKAADAEQQCSVLCGVHNISHPFRLKDSPENCGDRDYTLSCEEDNSRLMLYYGSGRYYVESINYNNLTIRLVDVNLHHSNFSLPLAHSFGPYNFSYNEGPYQVYDDIDSHPLVKSMLFVSCPNRVVDSSGVYVHDGAICMNSTSSYAQYGNYYIYYDFYDYESLWDLGLGDTCRIESLYLTSWPLEIGRDNNISCTDIRHMLFYGFQLSWLNALCKDGRRYVQIDGDKHRCSDSPGLWHALPLDVLYVLHYIITELIPLFYGLKFVLGVPCITVLLIYKWRRKHLSMYDGIEDFLCSDNNIMPIRYSYRDIKKITKQFKTKLGNGGYGSVFKGQLRSGRIVAVKLLDKAKSNGQDFINEVATIGRIHHVNVVRLIGFCVEGSKRALIYEFMPNGSLEKHIFSHEESSSLSCEKLYAISLGVARGIQYLHNGCNMKILHFDIKPHNVLLDENFNPKVSDFGLARLSPTDKSIVSLTAARGTIGYMAPELFYRNVGKISYKADVYSFGMLLMEMAGRRKNLNALAEQSSQLYFPFWVYDQLHDGREITIENDSDGEMKLAKKMMIVALWCIQTRPDDRPPMDKVLEMLEGVEELQMPNKPYLYPQDLPSDDVRDHSISNSSSSSGTPISDSKEST